MLQFIQCNSSIKREGAGPWADVKEYEDFMGNLSKIWVLMVGKMFGFMTIWHSENSLRTILEKKFKYNLWSEMSQVLGRRMASA